MTQTTTSSVRRSVFKQIPPAAFTQTGRNYPWQPGHNPFAVTGSATSPIKSKFEDLADAWRKNTRFSSSLMDSVLDSNYQQIIAIGVAAVPYILREMSKSPDHWYWALGAITQQNPAANVPAGDVRGICAAWLDWGKRRHLL